MFYLRSLNYASFSFNVKFDRKIKSIHGDGAKYHIRFKFDFQLD